MPGKRQRGGGGDRSSAHLYSVGGFARLEIYFPTKCRRRGLAAPPAAGYDIPRRVMHIRIFPYINFIEVKVDACLVECCRRS